MTYVGRVLLEQTTTWEAPDGRTWYVGELTDEQLGGALAYLGSIADRLHEAELRHYVESDDCGDTADPTGARRYTDPVDWLLERPLYRQLLAEQRRRAGADRPTREDV